MQKAIVTISKGCRRGFILTILKIMRDLAAVKKTFKTIAIGVARVSHDTL